MADKINSRLLENSICFIVESVARVKYPKYREKNKRAKRSNIHINHMTEQNNGKVSFNEKRTILSDLYFVTKCETHTQKLG